MTIKLQGCGTLRGACGSEHAHFVSIWHPTTNLATKCAEKTQARRILDAPLKQIHHRHGIYKMELIYIQNGVKCPGSPELALECKFLTIWYRHTQGFSWMILDLTNTKFAGDYDYET